MAATERTLQETPTWAFAVVCLVLVLISVFIEHIFHLVGSWFKRKHKRALYEALEKIKAELMLMGFISLLLTMGQDLISDICISESLAATWHPCYKTEEKGSKLGTNSDIIDPIQRKLLQVSDFVSSSTRRSLAVGKGIDKCSNKGKVAFVSAYAIHQLHIFIFILAVFHVLYCIVTFVLGQTKMKKWKAWENETKTIEYQYYNDPERFRFTRDTSFGRRHLSCWSRSPVTLWIVCFCRQFITTVTKVDYLTLRHGFIMAHLAPGSETKFDFQKYIKRSLEEDFKEVVGISPLIWFFALLFLLSNTHGWFSYLWLPFIPLIIILLVGAKLQVIITKMGLRIQERGDVVKGAPVVQPDDELFWFGRPRLMLFLIHFVLFQNAFQLAFFAWSSKEFGVRSCFHRRWEDVIIRISMGVIIQFLCSYVTLPLYALVTQMGSTMRPTIFNERVAAALRNWHRAARRNLKHNRNSEAATPFSSRPATPVHGAWSRQNLLQSERASFHPSPTASTDHWEEENQKSVSSTYSDAPKEKEQTQTQEAKVQHSELSGPSQTQHEIKVDGDFTFGK